MNRHFKVVAPAKINLALDVIKKRDDNYHNMEMIIQTVSLYDNLIVEKTNNLNIEILCANSNLILDDNNTINKAILQFYSKCMQNFTGIKVTLEKNIPIGAGLGGGSADAAATLVGLNAIESKNMSLDRLKVIGKKIGADVPFLIDGGTCLVTGIGDILDKVDSIPSCYIVIAKPKISVSTAEAFQKLNLQNIKKRPNIEEMILGLQLGDLKGICKNMYNVFEETCEINDVSIFEKIMIENNAINAIMTGTGSSVFGIFETEFTALCAFKKLKNFTDEVYLTKPIDYGAYVVL